jgi:cellobiose-specific phosphotransferase system component IIC
MLLFLLVLTYSHILPVLPLIGFFGTIYQYWIEKYVLLKRHKIPEVVGATISKFFSNMIPYALVIYSLSIFYQTMKLSDYDNYHGQYQIYVAIFLLLVPI